MPTVIGVDSSTQSCKLLVVDLESGDVVQRAVAPHPDGTEVDPEAWWTALRECLDQVDTSDVQAVSIGGQQHGLVALDADGRVVRPALLWNDTRSAPQAELLIAEFGADQLARRTGSLPVASFTSTKLAWMRHNEPELAQRVGAVALPHDWLSWRLKGFGPAGDSEFGPIVDELVTDRSDASGTGYFSAIDNRYDSEILEFALGHSPHVPRVAGPSESAGTTSDGWVVGAGGGDNAMAALGLDAQLGDAVISLGTSGTVFARTSNPAIDPSGTVSGFADASGGFLPLGATLNASRAIDSIRQLLGLSWDDFSHAVQQAEPGSGGLSMLPFFDGERMPNLPDATGMLGGMTRANLTAENLARASVESVVANLSRGIDVIAGMTGQLSRVLLIGGGAQNTGLQTVAAETLPLPVVVPHPDEYVALGAARQAAWALTGELPSWAPESATPTPKTKTPQAREQFQGLLDRVHGSALDEASTETPST